MAEEEVAMRLLVLYGEFFAAWHASFYRFRIAAGDCVGDAAGSAALAASGTMAVYRAADSAKDATRKIECSMSARDAWNWIFRNAKSLDAKIRSAVAGTLQLGTGEWIHYLHAAKMKDVLPAVRAYYAYCLSLLGITVFSQQLCRRAVAILHDAPRDGPWYADERHAHESHIQSLLNPFVPWRARPLVTIYAVPESVCDYFIRALD